MKRSILNTAALAAAALMALACANCNGKGTPVGDDRWEGDVDRLMEMFNEKHGFPPKNTTPPITPPDTTPTVVTPPDTTPTIVAPPAKYTVTVNSAGTGASVGGSYEAGATVTITAGMPPEWQKFKNWTTESAGVIFADANSATTTFTMQKNAVTVTAVFEASPNNCGTDGTASSCKTTVIDGKTWMAENLNVSTSASWCYWDDPANCEKYGRLYTWSAAVSACQSVGWRLPTVAEWDALYTVSGSDVRELKARSGWNYVGISSIGKDNFGFSALPGGIRDTTGSFLGVGNAGDWWTATEYDSGYAYYRGMNSSFISMSGTKNDVGEGLSARCVQD